MAGGQGLGNRSRLALAAGDEQDGFCLIDQTRAHGDGIVRAVRELGEMSVYYSVLDSVVVKFDEEHLKVQGDISLMTMRFICVTKSRSASTLQSDRMTEDSWGAKGAVTIVFPAPPLPLMMGSSFIKVPIPRSSAFL